MNTYIETSLMALLLSTVVSAQEWYQEIPKSAPAARRFHSLEFDTARGQSLLFGGIDERRGTVMGDTWSFDGASWTRLSASGPGPRYQHGACFERHSRRLIVFAGLDSAGKARSDTWSFNGRSWRQLRTKSAPPARSAAAMAYDSLRNRVVLFGGRDSTGKSLADTWEFDGRRWTVRTTRVAPPARHGSAMAFDSKRGVIVLFGGFDAASSRFDSQTWEWNGETWTKRKTAATPPTMVFPAGAFNHDHAVVVVTGSVGSASTAIATWALDGQDWHRGPTAPSALSGRQGHGLTFDLMRNAALLFGGASIARGGATPRADTWELSIEATVSPFGAGCSNSNGRLGLSASAKPAIGTQVTFALSELSVGNLPLLVLGSRKLALSKAACPFLVSVEIIRPMNALGQVALTVPRNPALLGAEVFAQGVILGWDAATSNGLELVLGN